PLAPTTGPERRQASDRRAPGQRRRRAPQRADSKVCARRFSPSYWTSVGEEMSVPVADTPSRGRSNCAKLPHVKTRALLLLGVAALAAVPAMLLAQRPEYPITVIAPGKGPFTFPEGYQTPWDRIDIRVT